MQGFNMGRYVPPEHEGLTSGNTLHKKKPPGVHGSTQTVRFEMPFNIFCLHCDGHIAQGVRFNAEKKKIGNYYSTPIFSFRMRHTVCSNWIEVQTDPKNTAYVVTEGAKKKAADEDPGVGVIRVRDPEEEAKRLENPFAKLEKVVEDKTEAKQGAARIKELKDLSDRQWEDPYEHSKKMRRVFRERRKELQAKDAATEAIRDRAGLHIELLDEIPEDAIRAKLIEFGPDHNQRIEQAHSKPLFPVVGANKGAITGSRAKEGTKGKTKAQSAADLSREKLQDELRRNTRARVDPFLAQDRPKVQPILKMLKRKQVDSSCGTVEGSVGQKPAGSKESDIPETIPFNKPTATKTFGISLGLEGYDSDD